MSNEDSSEKKHKPSQRRLNELQKDGNFLRAKEFYSGAALIAALLLLFSLSGQFYQTFSNNFYLTYSRLHLLIYEPETESKLFKQLAENNLYQLFPLFFGILLVFFLSVYVMGGLKFSKKLMGFKADRISPAKNIKKIFSLQNLVEVLKSILKIFLFISILLFFLHYYNLEILSLAKISDAQPIHHSLDLMAHYLSYLVFGIAIIASIDGAFNYYNYHKKAMMTDKEMKDESKETDGNPEVKRKQRQNQQAIAIQGLQQDIPKASVVITNPTHYAIALRYTDAVDTAPKIIAKGADHMALHIRTLAKKHGIPIYESPELARAIYFSSKVGAHIHPELYMAVAIVLSYIMQLQVYQCGQGEKPPAIDDLQIPEDFRKRYEKNKDRNH